MNVCVYVYKYMYTQYMIYMKYMYTQLYFSPFPPPLIWYKFTYSWPRAILIVS